MAPLPTRPGAGFHGPAELASPNLNPLFRNLHALGDSLNKQEAKWALVGGLAVGARTAPRFTRDIDLAVSVEDDLHAEAIVQSLRARGYQLLAVLEQSALGRIATVRLAPPGSDRVADLLFASSGLETEIAEQAEMLEIAPGQVVPVARLAHLIALKLLARDDKKRPQDRLDLTALIEVADEQELRICREAAQLILTRGFHRGRALLVELEQALVEFKD
jgi:predicted nucleotidyltransferase